MQDQLFDSQSDAYRSCSLQSKDEVYELSASIMQNSLKISLEDQKDLNRWSRSFSVEQINELTAKAGSERKFPIFCQMIFAAMSPKISESLKLDVKTPQELMEATRENTTLQQAQDANRLFLIIAYKAEFEAIFYPLTLEKVNYDLTNENELYLLQAYKNLKLEAEKEQELSIQDSQNHFCKSCANYQQKVSDLEEKLEETEEKSIEAVKVANMAVQARDKYKSQLKQLKNDYMQEMDTNKKLLDDNKKLYNKVRKLNVSVSQLSQVSKYGSRGHRDTSIAANSKHNSRDNSKVSSRASSRDNSIYSSRNSSRSASPSPYEQKPTRSEILEEEFKEKERRDEEKRERRYGSYPEKETKTYKKSVDKMEMLKNVNRTIEELKSLIKK